MKALIKALCAQNGPSGLENEVRDLIIQKLPKNCTHVVDKIGNVIVTHAGKKPQKSVSLFAHMDEVAVMVTAITESGLLKISPIGIDTTALFGKRLAFGANRIVGAVGAKAWHHASSDEREKPPKADAIYVDIGAANKAQAEAQVLPGDFGVFCDTFSELGGDHICSKALDNRIGCAILLELLASDIEYEFVGVFTCCEESGLLGATAAAHTVATDAAIVLETTTAGDIDGAPAEKTVCALGKGPVVSFADKGALYDRALYALAFEVAKKNSLAIQTKEGVFGGNESRAIASAAGGRPVLAISVPCRYLHSASSVARMCDVNGSLALSLAVLKQLLSHD